MTETAVQERPAAAAAAQPARPGRALRPAVDVVEDAAAITLYADLPGVGHDQLHLRVEGETLAIEGELSLSVPDGMKAAHAEVDHARYRRSFTLSKELDAANISAELKHGVLTVRIPKAAHAQPRRIPVTAA